MPVVTVVTAPQRQMDRPVVVVPPQEAEPSAQIEPFSLPSSNTAIVSQPARCGANTFLGGSGASFAQVFC